MSTSSNPALKAYVIGVGLISLFLAGWLVELAPDRAWASLLALSVWPIAWFAGRLQARKQATAGSARRIQQRPLKALALAGTVLAVSLAVVALSHSGWMPALTAELRQRYLGVFNGLIVMAFANSVPKQAGSARLQAALRASGWSLVLGGIGYATCWLLLPLAWASDMALVLLACALLYAVARLSWVCRLRRSTG